MLPTIEEAKKELQIAAKNIAHKLPDIGKTTLLCPPPWKPAIKN